jgi:hypothetical protein
VLFVRYAQAAEGRKAMNEEEPEQAAASAQDGLRVVTSRDDVTVGVTALKNLKAKQRARAIRAGPHSSVMLATRSTGTADE